MISFNNCFILPTDFDSKAMERRCFLCQFFVGFARTSSSLLSICIILSICGLCLSNSGFPASSISPLYLPSAIPSNFFPQFKLGSRGMGPINCFLPPKLGLYTFDSLLWLRIASVTFFFMPDPAAITGRLHSIANSESSEGQAEKPNLQVAIRLAVWINSFWFGKRPITTSR